jgi:S-adenosylmethionine:tRNA-ribosyltransferase-isomerase (queuine synthetase)
MSDDQKIYDIDSYSYDLPAELIAQYPVTPRILPGYWCWTAAVAAWKIKCFQTLLSIWKPVILWY